MKHNDQWLVVVLFLACLVLSGCGQTPVATAGKIAPAKVAPIEGTNFKRLTLVAEAAKRLDIQTAPVREVQVLRKRKVGGEVVSLSRTPTPTAAQLPDTVYVRVRLSENEVSKVDRGQPAVIMRLTGDTGASGLTGQPVKAPEIIETEDPATTLYYFVVGSAKYGLIAGQRVFVELPPLGTAAQRKLIPNAALLYDPKGNTWVYTNPESLVFIRQSVSIDYIEGDQAILLDGPAAGTAVVTVGGAELFGIEFGVGK